MNTKFLLKLLDPGFILKTGMVLLGLSLVVLGEMFLLDFISSFWGIYFTLAVAALTGLTGLFFSYRELSARISVIKDCVNEGIYSEKDFIQLAGAVAGALLLLIPGFITDFFGAVSFFPVIRMFYGKLITVKMGGQLNEIYEYLKLYD